MVVVVPRQSQTTSPAVAGRDVTRIVEWLALKRRDDGGKTRPPSIVAFRTWRSSSATSARPAEALRRVLGRATGDGALHRWPRPHRVGIDFGRFCGARTAGTASSSSSSSSSSGADPPPTAPSPVAVGGTGRQLGAETKRGTGTKVDPIGLDEIVITFMSTFKARYWLTRAVAAHNTWASNFSTCFTSWKRPAETILRARGLLAHEGV